jgi:general secretion pathway protein D
MGHRWNQARYNRVRLTRVFDCLNLPRAVARLAIVLRQLVDPNRSTRGISTEKPGFGKTFGSLMSRLAIPLQIRRLALTVVLIAAMFLASLPVSAKHEDSAKKLFEKGQAAEAREDYDTAYDDFKRAYAKAPNDLRMRASYYRLRQTASSSHVTAGRKLAAQGDNNGALTQFLQAKEIDPGNEAALQEIARVRARMPQPPPRNETSISEPEAAEMDLMGSPAQLKLVSNEPLTLHYSTEDSKNIYLAIGKAAGINVLFDPDYTSKRIQVDLVNTTLLDALRIVAMQSNTFWRPVTDNTIFVAQNSRAKRTELDEQAVQTFYLSNAWQQNDLNDVQTALRNVLPNAKVYGVPSQNALVMRATPDELTLAQKVINDLDKARPEVVVDVAIMEVDKDKLRNIGIQWPGSVGFALQPPQSSTTSTTSTTTTGTTGSTTGQLTLNNLGNLNANNFAVTVSAATANLLMTDANSKILQNPRIRATDAQKATMKIGEKIPIATGSYQTGAATAITSSLVNTQFQYIDVGVNIEMTPTVHFDHDVTLKLKIEDSSEGPTPVTISGVTEPIIIQKTSEQTIRLREGEASILSGILQKQDLVSISGIPGIGELPLLRYVFGSKSHEVIDDEVVFVLIPHIVREQDISPMNLRRIDTGSGQSIELRRTGFSNTPLPAPAGAASATPSTTPDRPASTTPGIAPLQGQTAAAAVNSAMSQLRQSAEGVAPGNAPLTPAVPAPAAAAPPSPVSFVLNAPAAGALVGTTFPVTVALNGAKDISSVPLQIQYDASKLTLMNVDAGDLLGKDGQAVALVHRDDGPGMIKIAASRPPGVAGVNGSGSVCVLTFQAKQAGPTDVVVTQPQALDSAQHPVPASAQNAHIVVH